MSNEGDVTLTARCERLYRRYARAVDRGDLEALRPMCLEDVLLTRGDATLNGIGALIDAYQAHVGPDMPLARHHVSNVVAETVASGISAQAYFQAWFYEETRTRVVSGSYDDRLVDHDGILRFAHKVNVVERVLVLPPSVLP